MPPPLCGNGEVDPGEECDDGNFDPGDGCDPLCRREACGNGRVDAREQCDDGNTKDGDGCNSKCISEVCGDGIINQAPGVEQCEPPSVGSCDASCHTIACGNGIVQGLEQCDDGNRADGDGCDENCRKEYCGNGQLDPGEDCEPPSSPNCDAQCHAVRVECGNGVPEPGEECDDGNVRAGDGCSPTCRIETCGNGRVEAPAEECEPPNTATCNAKCQIPRCGDGTVDTEAGEECEDGNTTNGDGCSSNCQIELCGNGRIEPPEQCEPPGTPACDLNCRMRANAPQDVQVPVSAALFTLRNATLTGSLDAWQSAKTSTSAVTLSSLDADGNDQTSGSAQIDVRGSAASALQAPALSLVIGDPTLDGASLGQCVLTAPGASYTFSAKVLLMAGTSGSASIELGARFYAGADCAGTTLDGVSTSYALDDTGNDWQSLSLPPPSPAALGTFAAPAGAGSVLVWLQVPQDMDDTSVLVDDLQLQRGSAPVCGDGIPEGSEQCEPSVTRGCTSDCKLPVVCGDGVAAPSECGPGASAPCPKDCPAAAPVCGDGIVTPPEECEPPSSTAANGVICSNACTIIHTVCGDGHIDTAQGEQCDPPDGETCDANCKTMKCGDGVVQAPEECDPPGAECTQHCRKIADYPATCGDGVLEGAETCDPPNPKTWCSPTCRRRDPSKACGDGVVDTDLGEQCDPKADPNCNPDCTRPRCGDGRVSGAEQCDPPDGTSCSASCRFIVGGALDCQACLGDSCRAVPASPAAGASTQDLFAACFQLDGVAESGPAAGAPLRQLCADVVACLARTGCDIDPSEVAPNKPDAASCYCGQSLLTDTSGQALAITRCRDGVDEASGACRTQFERAAGTTLPSAVLAAMDPSFGKPALKASLGLMTSTCAHNNYTGPATPPAPTDANGRLPGTCGARCTPQSTCGDGIVESGEACDPNDPEWGDNGSRWPAGVTHGKCDPTHCTILPCGNGVVDPGETCDVADPYTSGKGQCDDHCQVIATCGDGILTVSKEACDPGSGPSASWAGCCKPNDTTKDGLVGCDPHNTGVVDPAMACQRPQVCGNEIVEGSEECDPPGTATCDAQCKLIRTTPCDTCTQSFCTNELDQCFNADPSIKPGCIDTYNCFSTTHCDADNLLACYCGSLSPTVCTTQVGDGACVDKITNYIGIGGQCPTTAPPPSCVNQNFLSLGNPVGRASALVQCQQSYCFDDCFPGAP